MYFAGIFSGRYEWNAFALPGIFHHGISVDFVYRSMWICLLDDFFHEQFKADGILITKDRYVIPEKDGLFIELDVFHGEYEGVLLAEVEFPTEEAANAYIAPEWFGEDVTYSTKYHNSTMSQGW